MNDEGGGSLGREQLQGEPWHYVQMIKTCKEGSKYCIYNNKGKCFHTASNTHKQSCTGKGECTLFEPKTGSPKIYSTKCIHKNDIKKNDVGGRTMDDNTQKSNSDKAENFIRLANKRTNKILEDIEILGNLANKNQYEYTDEQVKKIFEAIENTVATTKESFKKKKPANKFSL